MENKTITFNFEISDPDDAVTSAKAILHEEEKILNNKGSSSAIFNVKPDEEHILEVVVEYDLDSDQLEPEKEDINVSKITEKKIFTLVSNYNLKISNLRTFQDNKETKYFSKNEMVQLRFQCTNSTQLVPEAVKINDIENNTSNGNWYDVHTLKNSSNEYYTEISTRSDYGTQQLEIDAIRLSSGIIIEKDKFKEENPSVMVEILKDKPKMEGYVFSNHENTITITFTVTDEDSALTESYVRLLKKLKKVK